MNIIITDSNDEVIAALRLVLEQKHGFTVIGVANNIIDLFSNVTQQCPDVVILDIDLPGLKPVSTVANNRLATFIQTLHTLCPSIYVIALSSLPQLERISLETGANAFAC